MIISRCVCVFVCMYNISVSRTLFLKLQSKMYIVSKMRYTFQHWNLEKKDNITSKENPKMRKFAL